MLSPLRPNQEPFVEAIRQATVEHDFVLGQAPTGYGKSFLISHMVDACVQAGHIVHVYAHRQAILDQLADDFTDHGIPFAMAVPGALQDPHAQVQLTTPFTMQNRLLDYPKPSFVFEDECHRSVAKTWGNIREWLKPDGRGIGLTATPARLDGKPMGSRFDHMVTGPSIKDLIADGSLVPMDVYAPPIEADWSQLKRSNGDWTQKSQEAVLNNKKITGATIEHYERIAAGTQAVAYCVSIAHATAVASQFEQAGIPAACLHSKMSKFELKAIVREFKHGSIRVLTSCDLITEGFNLPSLVTVIMLRKTESLVNYMQALGRALRSDKETGKTRAILLDHVGNIFRHGMPDADRFWTLEGGCTKTEEFRSSIRQCPGCFKWLGIADKRCACGYEFTGKERKWETDESGQLRLIAEAQAPKVSKMVLIRQELAGCNSLSEFLDVAKRHGYRPGWAQIQWNMRKNRARFFAKKKKEGESA